MTNTTEMTDFERGVRAGVETHDLYFRDENERSISSDFNDDVLEDFMRGAIRDALSDEATTITKENI